MILLEKMATQRFTTAKILEYFQGEFSQKVTKDISNNSSNNRNESCISNFVADDFPVSFTK